MAGVEKPVKSELEAGEKASAGFDIALAVHLAAGRFASPAGIAFIQQNHAPILVRRGR